MTDPVAVLSGLGRTEPRPPGGVDKFDDAGRVRRTPGLTTLCHIDRGSPAHAALTGAQARLRAGPHAGAFSFLPPDSFHMTVWDGVIDYRRQPGEWPAHLPLDTPMDAVEAHFDARLRGLEAPARITVRATGIWGGFTVPVTGADAAEETALRALRDRLAERAGLRRTNHESYRFHITLAYPVRWISESAAHEVVALSEAAFAAVAGRLAGIRLGPVEFCRFETMHRFDPIRRL